jgi:hypothetical protein
MAGVEETHRILQDTIIEAQERQRKSAGGNDMTLVVGIKVWLSARNLKTSRPSKKLEYKRTGPYTVSMIINRNPYKPDFLSTMRNHYVFHVSLLDRYTPPVDGLPSSELHPILVEKPEKWEVDCILGSTWGYRKLQYLVEWPGYNHIRTRLENLSFSIEPHYIVLSNVTGLPQTLPASHMTIRLDHRHLFSVDFRDLCHNFLCTQMRVIRQQ